MAKYTITIKGDWERQGFEVVCNVEEDVIQTIIADTLFTLQNAYGYQHKQPIIVNTKDQQ